MKTEDSLINFAYHICHVKSVKESQTLKSKTERYKTHIIFVLFWAFLVWFSGLENPSMHPVSLARESLRPTSYHPRRCVASKGKTSRSEIQLSTFKTHPFVSNTELLITPPSLAHSRRGLSQQLYQLSRLRIYSQLTAICAISNGKFYLARNWFVPVPTQPAHAAAPKTCSVRAYRSQLTRPIHRLVRFPPMVSQKPLTIHPQTVRATLRPTVFQAWALFCTLRIGHSWATKHE